jgi:hypothetical protein
LRSLRGGAAFDPEIVGFVLQQLPGFVSLASVRRADEFQDMPTLRRISVRGIRLLRWRYERQSCRWRSPTWHICDSSPGARALAGDVQHFDLTAPLWRWVDFAAGEALDAEGRAAECCAADGRVEFDKAILRRTLAAEAVAEKLAQDVA